MRRLLSMGVVGWACSGGAVHEPSQDVVQRGGSSPGASGAGGSLVTTGGALGEGGDPSGPEGGEAGSAARGGSGGAASGYAGATPMPGVGGAPDLTGWLTPCGDCDDPDFPVCAYVITENDTPGEYRCTSLCETADECSATAAVCRSDCGGCQTICAPKVDSITRWLAPCAAGCENYDARECSLISIGTEEAERCTFTCDTGADQDWCEEIGGTCELDARCQRYL